MTILDVLLAPTWTEHALCAQTDPEAFYPEKGGSNRAAKATCNRCPVRADCLTLALENDERFGIWGGYSERERRRLNADEDARTAALDLIASTPIDLPAIEDRTPAPTPTPRPEPVMPTITSPTQEPTDVTDYVHDMARVLSHTEGHPDKLVRDLRKLAVQAVQALATASTATKAQPATAPTKPVAPPPATGPSAKTVRAWAADQGLDCPQFGRVPAKIREAFDAAHAA